MKCSALAWSVIGLTFSLVCSGRKKIDFLKQELAMAQRQAETALDLSRQLSAKEVENQRLRLLVRLQDGDNIKSKKSTPSSDQMASPNENSARYTQRITQLENEIERARRGTVNTDLLEQELRGARSHLDMLLAEHRELIGVRQEHAQAQKKLQTLEQQACKAQELDGIVGAMRCENEKLRTTVHEHKRLLVDHKKLQNKVSELERKIAEAKRREHKLYIAEKELQKTQGQLSLVNRQVTDAQRATARTQELQIKIANLEHELAKARAQKRSVTKA